MADRHNLPAEALIFQGFQFLNVKRHILDACHLFHSRVGRRLERNHLNKTQNRGASFPDLRAVEIVSNDAGNISLEKSKQTFE